MFRHDDVTSQVRPRAKIKKLMCALGFLAAISAIVPNSAHAASAYPWCLEGDGLDCSYQTFEQCNRTVQGRGGSCIKFG